MAFIDYYKIMGIPKDTPQKDIRDAYKRRVKQFHPDLHPDDPKAKAKFQALQEAYKVLDDPEKRKQYDQYGENWEQAAAYGQAGGRAGFGNAGGSGFEGFDFSQFGNGGGGGFSSFLNNSLAGHADATRVAVVASADSDLAVAAKQNSRQTNKLPSILICIPRCWAEM